MNLFFPAYSICTSIMCLDDKTLIKQIFDCKTIYEVYNKLTEGYANHSIVKYYTQDLYHFNFAMIYATQCCNEYSYRFDKKHKYQELFMSITQNCKFKNIDPIYVDNKHSTTDFEEVVELFRIKLNKKWSILEIPPKWTCRFSPLFYTGNTDSQFYIGGV